MKILYSCLKGILASLVFISCLLSFSLQVQAQSNDNLSNLIVSPGTLSPTLDPAITNYTVNAGYATQFTFTAYSADPNATLKFGPYTDKSLVGGTFTLYTAATTFAITVTAVDGTSKTYTIVVTKQNPLSYASPKPLTLGTTIAPLYPLYQGAILPGYYPNGAVLTDTQNNPFLGLEGVVFTKTLSFYILDGGAIKRNTAYTFAGINGTIAMLGENGSSIAVDNSLASSQEDILYVSCLTSNTVKRIIATPLGGDQATVFASGFNQPKGVAVDGAGNVYVADYGNNAIMKIPAAGGTPVSIGAGFYHPNSVAVDTAGNVYVAEGESIYAAGENNDVKEILAATGKTITITTPQNGLKNPQAITLHNGNICFFDSGVVKEIPVGGGPTIQLAYLEDPVDFIFSGNTLYVADAHDHFIDEYLPENGYTINQPLPQGLSLNTTTGVISGTPTAASPVTSYVITAQNYTVYGSATINLGVSPGALTIAANSQTIAYGAAIPAFTASFTGFVNGDRPSSLTQQPTFSTTATAGSPSGTYPIIASGAVSNNYSITYVAGTLTILPAPPAMSYSSPQVYPMNAAIMPLSPANSVIVNSVATTPGNSQSLAVDNNGNAYEIVFPGANIAMFPLGGGTPVTAYNGNASGTNLSVATISATASTLIFGNGSQVEAMDYANGAFQAPVAIGTSTPGGLIVSAAHPASGPDVMVVFKGANSQIYFTSRTAGVWSTPAAIPNAIEGFALALNICPTGVKLAFAGQDNNLYYAIYADGAWSAVAPWSTPSANLGPVGSFALDTQGNLWFTAGSALEKMVPRSAVMSTIPPQAALVNIAAIAFDTAGNFYANCGGTQIEMAEIGGGFQVSPGLPAGLGIDGNTGIISGTPTAVTAATDYTVTATAGSGNLSAIVNIQILPPNVNLSNLSVSGGTLSPVFAQSTLDYADTVSHTTATITVTPTAADPAATITVNGTAVTSGNPSAAVNLNVGSGNTVPIVVTSADGTFSQTYNLVVDRISSVASLSHLTVSSGTLAPAFTPATSIYTATVGSAVSSVTVTPTVSEPNAKVTVNGASVTSGSASLSQPLITGANTIKVVVTAQDGTTMRNYAITVTRPSANATLSGLAISSGTLSPAFAANKTTYTASVSNAITSITLTPTLANAKAAITVNGNAVTSGSATGAIPLNTGSNVITVIVTAQDGTTTDTYTITITRALSSNANLAGLSLSSGTLNPAFDINTFNYAATVPNSVSAINVTPVSSDAGATITVNGSAVTSGSASGAISLNVGSNTITTTVTAQDGITTATYSTTITRASSANANLAGLTLSAGSLKPAFSTATTGYVVSVGNGIASITLTPTTSDATAAVTVNGAPVTSGTASTAMPLNVGPNTITTIVTAQDGATMQTYTVTVTRAPSTNAKLLSLTTSAGVVSPAFSNTVTSYTRAVANTVNSVTVTPTTIDPTATLTVNGAPTSSGTSSAAIPLNVGANTISTVVTAQDGTTKITYTITVTRAPSADATLASLAISPGTIKPAFTSANTAYTVAVGNGVTSVTVTPTTTDPGATIKIGAKTGTSGTASDPIALAVGANTIAVVITAQNGVTTKNYKITVTRAPSNNAKLLSLTTSSGAVSPAFNNAITSYTRAVPNSVTSITFKPTVVDKTATITVNGTTTASNTSSTAQPLVVGANTENIVVTAQDGKTTITYTVTVTRAMGAANTVYEPVSVAAPTEKPILDDDVIVVHQGLSPNGDGVNDFLQIDGILAYPDNKLQIMNRSGQLVFETKNYDNSSKVFDGHSNKNGQMQLPGTYFYALDYTVKGVAKHKTGFIVLKY